MRIDEEPGEIEKLSRIGGRNDGRVTIVT